MSSLRVMVANQLFYALLCMRAGVACGCACVYMCVCVCVCVRACVRMYVIVGMFLFVFEYEFVWMNFSKSPLSQRGLHDFKTELMLPTLWINVTLSSSKLHFPSL